MRVATVRRQLLAAVALAVAVFLLVLFAPIGERDHVPALAPAARDPSDIQVPDGYQVELVIAGLTAATTCRFDAEGYLHICEAGYGPIPGRILKLTAPGKLAVVASGFVPPLNGLAFYRDGIYVSHRGRISSVGADGHITDIVTGLPSLGDHQNNMLAIGPDGKLYFGQGTATNSGIVGVDNYMAGWLRHYPFLSDYPARDVKVNAVKVTSDNPLSREPGDTVETGALKPFGVQSKRLEIIPGAARPNGVVFRASTDGSGLEVFAWGLRNPFGIGFTADGRLYVTEHGFDVRGSRPIANTPDFFYLVEQGKWYGWPDFAGGVAVTDPRFAAPGDKLPGLLLATHPLRQPPHPKAEFAVHAGANGFAFSSGDPFGFLGDAFVALFGDITPLSVATTSPSGHRVAVVDMKTGEVSTFAANRQAGPASLAGHGGLERPTDCTFGPDGALYITDWGQARLTAHGLEPVPGTGAVWKIYKQGTQPQVPVSKARKVGGNSLLLAILALLLTFVLTVQARRNRQAR
ncbi:MAG: PQQ-dependent sugar dehydrogenase [Bacillota bacterium]